MFGGQICFLMGLVVLLLFVPVLRCMISTKSNLFNNFVLLIMFKNILCSLLQAYGNFCGVLYITCSVRNHFYPMAQDPKKKYYSASLKQILLDV